MFSCLTFATPKSETGKKDLVPCERVDRLKKLQILIDGSKVHSEDR